MSDYGIVAFQGGIIDCWKSGVLERVVYDPPFYLSVRMEFESLESSFVKLFDERCVAVATANLEKIEDAGSRIKVLIEKVCRMVKLHPHSDYVNGLSYVKMYLRIKRLI
jgi:hypothetical protein